MADAPHYPTEGPDELLGRPPQTTAEVPIEPRGPRRLGRVTLGLGAVVIVAAGFVGGLAVGHGTGSSAAASTQRGPAGLPGGAGAAGGYGQRSWQGGQGAGQGAAGAGQFGRPVSGTVTAVDGQNLTVQTSDGTTVTVTTSGDTTVTQSTTSSVSALTKGAKVTVMGQEDGDSVTARSIVTGDAAGLRFGGRAPGSGTNGANG